MRLNHYEVDRGDSIIIILQIEIEDQNAKQYNDLVIMCWLPLPEFTSRSYRDLWRTYTNST